MRNMGDPGQSVGGAIGAALGGVIAQLGSLLVALGASRYRRRLGLLAAGTSSSIRARIRTETCADAGARANRSRSPAA